MKPESHDQRSCCVVPRPSVLRAGRAHVWPLGYALEVRLTSLVCALEKAHPFVQPNFERRHFEIHLVYFHSPPHFHELPHPQKNPSYQVLISTLIIKRHGSEIGSRRYLSLDTCLCSVKPIEQRRPTTSLAKTRPASCSRMLRLHLSTLAQALGRPVEVSLTLEDFAKVCLQSFATLTSSR